MTAKASVDVGAVIAAYDFTPFGRIADIGGGRGHLLRVILEAAPGAEGILFDLPMVIDTLNAGDQLRLTLPAGDFFVDALPSADLGASTLDIIMLTLTGGRERTVSEPQTSPGSAGARC